jgi:LmbE family N-acetylglucosaminyl deacetylase
MTMEAFPEDWDRALAVVAHPDDMEYGAASAVARWTVQGKTVNYLLVTRGEAGISDRPPEEVGPLRMAEQQASCVAVGVERLEFLDYADGLVVESVALRADLAAAIRRHRPEVLLSINYRDSWGGPSWNHADHRVVGRCLLDAARDAANRWVFPDRGEPWSGVRFAAFNGSPQPTHGVDVTGFLEAGIASLACHATYLAALGPSGTGPETFLRQTAEAAGPSIGVALATTFELVMV